MLPYLIAYAATLASFVVADLIWLGLMMPRFYKPILADIALGAVNLPPAVFFYALYPVGLVVFAIAPALKSGSLATAAIHGALFGFFTYATYDLTNQATLRNWTWPLTMVDVAWGTLLGALAAAAGFFVASRLA
jgi:uncharacterized membrane protein